MRDDLPDRVAALEKRHDGLKSYVDGLRTEIDAIERERREQHAESCAIYSRAPDERVCTCGQRTNNGGEAAGPVKPDQESIVRPSGQIRTTSDAPAASPSFAEAMEALPVLLGPNDLSATAQCGLIRAVLAAWDRNSDPTERGLADYWIAEADRIKARAVSAEAALAGFREGADEGAKIMRQEIADWKARAEAAEARINLYKGLAKMRGMSADNAVQDFNEAIEAGEQWKARAEKAEAERDAARRERDAELGLTDEWVIKFRAMQQERDAAIRELSDTARKLGTVEAEAIGLRQGIATLQEQLDAALKPCIEHSGDYICSECCVNRHANCMTTPEDRCDCRYCLRAALQVERESVDEMRHDLLYTYESNGVAKATNRVMDREMYAWCRSVDERRKGES